ncbi:hypothetical protein LCGC14_0484730 [marine sediment metagenome]|uniref:Uncharacterized protein n=1 Tax=marine sediment metagenome TaxID=412755 RepID=A0A0F9S850_9ZZZZ
MGGVGSGVRKVGGVVSVEELIRGFGRPLTTYEIMLCLEGVVLKDRIYREIRGKIKCGVFRDFILDFRPFYPRQVRLVGLNVAGFKMKFK